MKKDTLLVFSLIVVLTVMSCTFTLVFAQQMAHIPTLQACNKTKVGGKAVVKIKSREVIPGEPGSFKIKIDVHCSAPQYPEGKVYLSILLSDCLFKGDVESTTLYQLSSMGKHSPTAFLSGSCKVNGFKGCKFWLMIADNGTEDIISFLIIDGDGRRLAHGTGLVVEGNVEVHSTT